MEPAADARREYLDRIFGLGGVVAVVTGGGGLIGGELCRALARAGARVGVLGRSRPNCAAIAAGIAADGGSALAVTADVLDDAALARAHDTLMSEFGRIDILINAAGGQAAPTARLRPDQPLFDPEFGAGTRAAIELNLLGTITPIFAFGDALAAGDGGAIVNVSSAAARHVSSGVMGYSAAKAGVEQLTRWLAVEAGRRYGTRLRVNAVSPGFTVGPKTHDRFFEADGTPSERTRTVVGRIPLGRLGAPADLVSTVLWLCAPASSYVTGVVVPADGGHGLDTGV